MALLLVALVILALLLGGFGFAVHVLWWIAIVVAVVAVLAWVLGRPRL